MGTRRKTQIVDVVSMRARQYSVACKENVAGTPIIQHNITSAKIRTSRWTGVRGEPRALMLLRMPVIVIPGIIDPGICFPDCIRASLTMMLRVSMEIQTMCCTECSQGGRQVTPSRRSATLLSTFQKQGDVL